MKRRGRVRGCAGQSIVEYLTIITVVILAIIAIRGLVQGNMNTLFTSAATQTGTAAGKLGAIPGD